MVLQRGFMTKNCQQTTSRMIRASLLCPPQFRQFSDWGDSPAGGDERPPQTQQNFVDERVPRFFKNKIVLLGIPAGVTKDDLLESFKEFNVAEDKLTYQS